jgi:hypothetical protein
MPRRGQIVDDAIVYGDEQSEGEAAADMSRATTPGMDG